MLEVHNIVLPWSYAICNLFVVLNSNIMITSNKGYRDKKNDNYHNIWSEIRATSKVPLLMYFITFSCDNVVKLYVWRQLCKHFDYNIVLQFHIISYGEPIRIPAQQGHSPPQAQIQYTSKEPEPAVLPAQYVEDNEVFPMEGERWDLSSLGPDWAVSCCSVSG